MRFRIILAAMLMFTTTLVIAQPTATKLPREALAPFGDLVGVWKGTGNIRDAQKTFWTDKMEWGWQFKGNDAWIKIDFNKNKYFTTAELRAVPGKDQYSFTVTTVEKEKLTFVGELGDKMLTLERNEGKESQKLVFTFLHANRFLYRYDVKPEGRPLYTTKWSVGASPDGVPFASGDGRPECVVSGGRGTTAVTFNGKTYYVCCSGCADEFRVNAAKYVKEYEEKLAKKNKK